MRISLLVALLCLLPSFSVAVQAPESKTAAAETLYAEKLAHAGKEADPSEYRALAVRAYEKDLQKEGVSAPVAKQKVKEKVKQLIDIDFYAAYLCVLKLYHIEINELKALFTQAQNEVLKALSQYTLHRAGYPNTAPAKGLPWSARYNSNTAAYTSPAATYKDSGNTELSKGVAAYNSQNFTQSFSLFKQAAEKGNDRAMYNLGLSYEYGKGTAKNTAQARYWYERAEAKGNTGATTALARIGRSTAVASSSRQTTTPETTAADSGSADYAKGAQAYTQKNYTEAFNRFKTAAEKGYVKAAAILGAMCFNGEGASKNETEEFNWYKLAAEGGYLEAKHNVGVFDAAGKGVQANYHEARKWLKEAAREGYPKSPEILWELDKAAYGMLLMSPNQLHDWEGTNGKLGYKDKASGSIWIPANYEDGGLISEVEQLAPAKLNGKWGFIDLYNKPVIPFQYEDAEPLSFVEGLAAVKQNGKWGFIDKTGKPIIPFQYDKVVLGCFVNGYAKVIQTGKTLFIRNPLDKLSTAPKSAVAASSQPHPSSDSAASAAPLSLTPFEGANGKYGYKDQSGNVIVEPNYDFAYEFSEGLAGVHVLGIRFGTGYGRSI